MFKKSFAIIAILTALPTATLAGGYGMTAAEVKPILEMTKGNWVAVREFNGQDLVYFTHLESWRCGLEGVKFGINGGEPTQVWSLEECYEDEAAPNAMKMEDGLPYFQLPLNMVKPLIIEVTFDDGTVMTESFERNAIMTP